MGTAAPSVPPVFSTFNIGLVLFGLIAVLGFIFVTSIFIFVFVKIIGQNNKNKNAAKLSVPALVVAKRTNISHSNDTNTSIHHSSASTSYFVTFQVDSGDRMEFRLSGYDYGMLAEGDRGMLSFQGTQYNGFERT